MSSNLPATFTPQYLRQLELLKLATRKSFLGSRQGGHVSPRRGHGIEFSDYRKYEMGDNPRAIDWNVYGRTEKLYIKRFHEEEDLSVLFFIDNSLSMRTPAEALKWEYARDLALSLIYITLIAQDTVLISVPGKDEVPKFLAPRSFGLAAKFLGDALIESPPSLLTSARRAVAQVRFPGLAIVVSDFLFPSSEAQELLKIMLAKGIDVTAIQVLAPSDRNPLKAGESARVVDSEHGKELDLSWSADMSGHYSQVISEHEGELRAAFNAQRVRFATVDTSKPLISVVSQQLPRLRILS